MLTRCLNPKSQNYKHYGPLPAHIVSEIRRRVSNGERQAEVARSLNIQKSVVNRVTTGRTYNDLD
jgi:hypothetical protein